MDILFYNNNKEVIGGLKNVPIVPQVNEHILFDDRKEYIVKMVIHDYKKCCIHVWVRPATHNDVTFLS